MKVKYLLLIYFLFFQHILIAQTSAKNPGTFIFEGIVFGYENDASRKLFKKNKQTFLEGRLEEVVVNVYINDKLFHKTMSNSKGEFKLNLNLPEIYKIELFKEDYDNNVLYVDTREIPLKRAGGIYKFTGAEFILNSFKIKNNVNINGPVGTLYFNSETGYIDFKPSEDKDKKTGFLNKKEEQDNLTELIKRAVLKNREKDSFKPASPRVSNKKASPKDISDSMEIHVTPNSLSEFQLSPNKGIREVLKNNIRGRKEDIRKARKELERDKLKAVTEEDFLLIQQREVIINAAEHELKAALILIKMQKSKIKMQSNVLYLSISALIMLMGLLFFIFFHYKEKSKMNLLLERKNKKITDSINYAHRIQQSILLGEKEIRKSLPDSFIYYRPKDIVSGDFYWFSEVKGKLVIAVVDCTGHGVPGAFMSLIGNTLLNQIVNEKQVLDPAFILKYLHEGVLKALRQEEKENLSGDGMEMSLCVIDPEKRTMEFSGAMNPLYIVQENSINVIEADIQSIGGGIRKQGREEASPFTVKKVSLSKDTSVYMFTDGYMDQFGGVNNKKFNTANFKRLLLDIQQLDMEEQKKAMHNAMEDWKKTDQQVDDILVAGFKLGV